MATRRRAIVKVVKQKRRRRAKAITRTVYPQRSFTSAKGLTSRVRTATAQPTLLVPVANDERATAIVLDNYTQGLMDFDNTTATHNATDPGLVGTGYNSIWYSWTPGYNGAATFQTGPQNLDGNTDPFIDTLMGCYTWNGTSYTTITENDNSTDDPSGFSSKFTFTAAANQTYYIAVASKITTKYTDVTGATVYGIGPGYLSWNFDITDNVITPDQISFTPTSIDMAPAMITVTVSLMTTGATITATIGATTIGSDVVDDAGTAVITGIVPLLTAGAYTVTVTQNSPAISGTDILVIANNNSVDAATPDGSLPTFSVTKWKFYDPTNATAYDFEINPDTYDTPYPERALTTLLTTDVDGQVLVFEGNQKPATWSWQGWIKTQTQHDAFVLWLKKRYRIVLYDHLGRRIVLQLLSFDPSPVIKAEPNPYLMRYTMTANMYSVT